MGRVESIDFAQARDSFISECKGGGPGYRHKLIFSGAEPVGHTGPCSHLYPVGDPMQRHRGLSGTVGLCEIKVTEITRMDFHFAKLRSSSFAKTTEDKQAQGFRER